MFFSLYHWTGQIWFKIDRGFNFWLCILEFLNITAVVIMVESKMEKVFDLVYVNWSKAISSSLSFTAPSTLFIQTLLTGKLILITSDMTVASCVRVCVCICSQVRRVQACVSTDTSDVTRAGNTGSHAHHIYVCVCECVYWKDDISTCLYVSESPATEESFKPDRIFSWLAKKLNKFLVTSCCCLKIILIKICNFTFIFYPT